MTTNTDNQQVLENELIVFISNQKLYIEQIESFNPNSQVEIYDLLGQKLYENKLAHINGGISLPFPSSYYIIKVNTNAEIMVRKFFIP